MKRLLPLLALLAFLPHRGVAQTTVGHEISTLPYTILKPGTYYTTKDLTDLSDENFAIRVESSDVLVDFNGHGIISNTGSSSQAIGIVVENANKVTIRDGIIQDFQNGIVITGNGANVNNLVVYKCLESGISVVGNYAQITHNHISETGGSANTALLYSIGIRLTGTDGVISDNDVSNTFMPDVTSRYADGIQIVNSSNIVISNNRVLDVEPVSPTNAASTGIAVGSSQSVLFLSNIVSTAQTGFDFSGAASGKYGDNITLGVTNTYKTTGSGMTDIGGNN